MIMLSERAQLEVRRIVSEQSLGEGTFLRVGVKGGGCSGFQYTLGFDDMKKDTDQTSLVEGDREEDIEVVCDPKSFLYLNNTIIDFADGLMSRGFEFKNPSATKSCGCGESFSV
mgnify:CR=1 FL=1